MGLSHDLRAALRRLARKPLATSAAAATLALGNGSSVARRQRLARRRPRPAGARHS